MGTTMIQRLDDRADDGEPGVHVETLTRGLTITDPADVAAYKDAFAELRALAVTGDEAEHAAQANRHLHLSASLRTLPRRSCGRPAHAVIAQTGHGTP